MKRYICIILCILFTCCMFAGTYVDDKHIFGNYTLTTDKQVSYNINATTYDNAETSYTSSGPRKASWDSGSGSATSDDGTVTISYTWKRTGFGTYVITYSNGTTETVTTLFGYGVDSQAQSSAKEKANEIAEERKSLPIGSQSILFLFAIGYIAIKAHKNML